MPMPISTTSVQDVKKAYQGNPGALQQRVGQAQQGGMPPKLIELMALQEIQEMMKNTQVAQQLGNGAQQMPTVAEKLQGEVMAGAREKVQQQMGLKAALAGRQQQAQQDLLKQASSQPGAVPEGTPQPQEQPKAEGLDRLQSNLGEFYSGGIVAFNGEDGSQVEGKKKDKYETPYDRMNRENRELEQRQRAEREARAQSLKTQMPAGPDGIDVSGAAPTEDTAVGTRGLSAPFRALADVVTLPYNALKSLTTHGGSSLTPFYDKIRDGGSPPPAAPAAPATQADVRKIDNQIAATNPAAMQGVTPPPAPPKPPVGGIASSARSASSRPAGVAPAPAADPLDKALTEHALTGLKPIDEEVTRTSESSRFRKETGIDGILRSREARAKKLEDLQAQQAGTRDKWGEFIYSMDPYARGGLGASIVAGGRGLRTAQGNWANQDKANLEQMNKIYDELDAARLSGNTAAYNAGLAKLKSEQEKQEKAATVGANVFGTKTQAQTAREGHQTQLRIAEINAAAMRAARAGAADAKNVTNAINAIKGDETINSLQKQIEGLSKLPTKANKAEALRLQGQIEMRQRQIYKHFGVDIDFDTMPPAPGVAAPQAAGPGGNKVVDWNSIR